MCSPMKRYISLIQYKSGLTSAELAKERGITRQHLSRLKSTKNKILEMLVKDKEKYNLTWEEIGEALEHDYK